jgi:hypothetical protein
MAMQEPKQFTVMRHRDGSDPVKIRVFDTEAKADEYITEHTIDGINVDAEYNCAYLYIKELEDQR